MAIIQSINTASAFADAFQRMGRGDQFTHSALEALFDFYDSLGEDVELDPIAICCDWCEYSNAVEACAEYGIEYGIDEEDKDQTNQNAYEALCEHNLVLECGNGRLVVQSL